MQHLPKPHNVSLANRSINHDPPPAHFISYALAYPTNPQSEKLPDRNCNTYHISYFRALFPWHLIDLLDGMDISTDSGDWPFSPHKLTLDSLYSAMHMALISVLRGSAGNNKKIPYLAKYADWPASTLPGRDFKLCAWSFAKRGT